MKRAFALAAVMGLATLGLSTQLHSQAGPQAEHAPLSPEQMAQHQVQRYTTLLSLSPAQVEQATTLFTAEATARSGQHATERAAHEALEAAIKANDKEIIQSTATAMGQKSGEMMAAHALLQAQFYAMLTAEQKAKYSELEEEHRMGPHGPGMR